MNTGFDATAALYSMISSNETGAYDVSPLTIAKTFSVKSPANPNTLSINSAFIKPEKVNQILETSRSYSQYIGQVTAVRDGMNPLRQDIIEGISKLNLDKPVTNSVDYIPGKASTYQTMFSNWYANQYNTINQNGILEGYEAQRTSIQGKMTSLNEKLDGLYRTRVHSPSEAVASQISAAETNLSTLTASLSDLDRSYNDATSRIGRLKRGVKRFVAAGEDGFETTSVGKKFMGDMMGKLTASINSMTSDMTDSSYIASVIEDIGITNGDFVEFGDSFALNQALETIDDPTTKEVFGNMYNRVVGSKGITSYKKADFLVENKTYLDKAHTTYIPGVYDIENIKAEDVEKMFVPLSTDEAREIVTSAPGEDKASIGKLSTMIDGYIKDQAEMSQEEKASYILANREKAVTSGVSQTVVTEPKGKPKITNTYTAKQKRALITDKSMLKYVDDGTISVDTALDLQARALSRNEAQPFIPESAQSAYNKLDDTFFNKVRNVPDIPTDVISSIDSYNTNVGSLRYLETSKNPQVDVATVKAAADKYGADFNFALATTEQKEDIIAMAKQQYIERANKNVESIGFGLRKMGDTEKDMQRAYLNELSNREFEEGIEMKSFINSNGDRRKEDFEKTLSEKFDEQYDYAKRYDAKIERELKQASLTQSTIDESTDEIITRVRQRDQEVVKLGLAKTEDLVESISIGRPITRTDLERGYIGVGNRNVKLEAIDEFTSLMKMSDVRITGENAPTFTPQEWLDGRVKFGDFEYDIRKFSEYYNEDIRKQQVGMLRGLPGSPEVTTRANIEDMINNRLKEYVTDADESVEYSIRRRLKGEDLSQKTKTFKERMRVPLFREEEIPSRVSQRRKTKLKAIKGINPNDMVVGIGENGEPIRGAINMTNYEEAFKYYGVDPKNVKGVSELMEAYNNAIPSYKLTNDDKQYLEQIIELDNVKDRTRAAQMKALQSGKEPPKRLVAIQKEIDSDIEARITNSIETGAKLQRKGDIVGYRAISSNGKYAQLEADHINVNDVMLDVKYSGDKTTSQIVDELNQLRLSQSDVEIGGKISDLVDSKILSNGKAVMNDQPLYIGSGANGPIGISRADIANRIFGDTERLTFDVNGKKYHENIPKVVKEVTGANWSWMLDSQDIGYHAQVAATDAIYSIDPLDVARAGEDLGINFSDVHNLEREVIDSTIDRAVAQKAKGTLIRNWMTETKQAGQGPEVRVAVKILETQGIAPTPDNVRDTLISVQKEIGKSDLGAFYKSIDTLVNDKKEIATQLAAESKVTSLDDYVEMQQVRQELLDSYGSSDPLSQANSLTFNKVERMMADSGETNEAGRRYAKAFGDAVEKEIDGKYIDANQIRAKVIESSMESEHVNRKQMRSTLQSITNSMLDGMSKHDKRLNAILTEVNRATITENIITASAVKNKAGEVVAYNTEKYISSAQKVIPRAVAPALGMDRNLQLSVLSSLNKNGGMSDVLDGINTIGRKRINGMIRKNVSSNKGYSAVVQAVNTLDKDGAMNVIRKVMKDGADPEKIYRTATASPLKAGMLHLFGNNPNEALAGLSKNGLHANNIESMDMFKMLQDLFGKDALSISARAEASDGRIVSFPYSKEYKGVVMSNDGIAYRLVSSKDEAIDTVLKPLYSGYDIDYKKVTPTLNQMSHPIINPKAKGRYNLTASALLDYDNVTYRGSADAGMLDPVSTLENYRKAISKDGTRVAIYDLETTGLPGKMKNNLFRPVEFSVMDTVVKNGELVQDGDISTYFIKPTKDIQEAVEAGTKQEFKSKYLKELEDMAIRMSDTESDAYKKGLALAKNDPDIGLIRNYAKYAEGTGELWGNKIRVTKNGAVDVLDETGTVLKSFSSSIAYVDQMTSDAHAVTNFLLTGEAGGKKFTISPTATMVDFEESVRIMANRLNKVDYVGGHNINGADNQWMKIWKKEIVNMGDNAPYKVNSKTVPTDFFSRSIDSLELFKIAKPGRENYKLENTIKDGQAHLANVDIEGTRQLFNSFSGDSRIATVMDDLDKTMKPGDIFVKDGVDRVGIKNMDKGVYEFLGISQTKKLVDEDSNRYINQTVLNVRNVTTGDALEVSFQSDASLKREAMRNWVPFADKASAQEYQGKKMATDTNRTMRKGFNYETWNDYYGKGKHMQKEVSEGLTAIGEQLTDEVIDARSKEVVDGMLSMSKWDDAQLLAFANKEKVTGKGLVDEIARINDVRADRLPEYERFARYAESGEGKTVNKYLYENDLRRRVWGYRTDKEIFKDFDTAVYNTVKGARESLIENGVLSAEEYMVEIPNKKRMLSLSEEAVGGMLEGYNVKGLGTVNVDIDITNQKSISTDMWNTTQRLAKQIRTLNPELKASNRALQGTIINDIIMPAMTAQYKGTELIQEDLQKAVENISHNRNIQGTAAIDVDVNLRNTMKVLTANIAEASKNKSELLTNLETVREVNMYKVIDDDSEAGKQINKMLDEKFETMLTELDDNLATRQVFEGGEQKLIVDDNIKMAQAYMVEMKRKNDSELSKAVTAVTGSSNPEVIMAHLNTSVESEAVRTGPKITDVIRSVDNQTRHGEYATYSANQIKEMADNIPTRTYIPDESTIEALYENIIAKGEVNEAMVGNNEDFIKYLHSINNGSWASKGGYVNDINFKIKNRPNRDVREKVVNDYFKDRNINGINDYIAENRKEKDALLKVLADRAFIVDDANRGLQGEVAQEIIDSNRVKYEAMEAIGLIQEHNGKKYTGRIGLPGTFTPGVELDPSKVVIGSTYKSGAPMSALTYGELKAIRDNKMANSKHRAMAGRYMSELDKSFEQAEYRAVAQSTYDDAAKLRYGAFLKSEREAEAAAILASSEEKESVIKALNERVTKAGMDKKRLQAEARQGSEQIQNTLDEVMSVQDSSTYKKIESTVDEAMDVTRTSMKKVLGSKVVKYSLVAGAAALALSSLHHYNSSGKTKEQQQVGDEAPMVDGNYERAYNGTRHDEIKMPKTVRLEENGTGMTINVNARNRNRVNRADISTAVGNTLQSTMGADVNFRYSDDTSTINQDYVQGLFSDALR